MKNPEEFYKKLKVQINLLYPPIPQK